MEVNQMMTLNEEKGFVFLTTLLIMVILTLVGIGAIMNSGVEINIARNERIKKEAFYAADAGSAVVPRIIKYYVGSQPASIAALPDDLQDIAQDDDFLDEINGTSATDNACSSPDFQASSAGRQVNIDIDRVGVVQPTGQDIVFLGESGVAAPLTFITALSAGDSGPITIFRMWNCFIDIFRRIRKASDGIRGYPWFILSC